jgi:hypothetical protein
MADLVEKVFMNNRAYPDFGKFVCKILQVGRLHIFTAPAVDGNFHDTNLHEFRHWVSGVKSELIFMEEEGPFIQLVKTVFKPQNNVINSNDV